MRFHSASKVEDAKGNLLTTVLVNLKPHLLIRRYDREEDSFLTVSISQDGDFEILSNDINFASRYLHGLFLECPPSFHSADELEEAEKTLSIANYRSCVVMCRRTIEALLKFAFPRLLGGKAIDNKGRELTLNTMRLE